MKCKEYQIDDKNRNINTLNVHEINIYDKVNVLVGSISFYEGIISKITIHKYKSEYLGDSLFVELYMGNVKVATSIFNSDIIVDLNINSSRDICIREAKNYDYDN
ncbi:MAG: hypothetical protein FH761_10430 [Firmicutes bacterium]|nr:hypothetical protein [Bacillota bacterium]